MASLALLFGKAVRFPVGWPAANGSHTHIMPVRIRLKRVGTKNQPAFRVVVADGRSPRDGRFIEEIGTYLPLKADTNFTINLERVEYWVSKGAQPSDTVASFIRKARRATAQAPAAQAPAAQAPA